MDASPGIRKLSVLGTLVAVHAGNIPATMLVLQPIGDHLVDMILVGVMSTSLLKFIVKSRGRNKNA